MRAGPTIATRRLPSGANLPVSLERLLVVGIVVVAAILRLAWLGDHSIWYDEAFTVQIARSSWGHLLPTIRSTDMHPPLYYLIMKTWVGLAGTSEAAIRLPSVVFGIVSVVLTYCLGRRLLSERVGLVAGALLAVSPFSIMASQDARMYALLSVLVLSATLALLIAVERESVPAWSWYAILIAATIYTHYLALFTFAAHGLWILIWHRPVTRSFLISLGCATLAYLLWIPSIAHQITQTRIAGWYPVPVLRSIGDLFGLFTFGGSLFGAASFFSPGTLSTGGRFLLLLPFLVVIGSGIAALQTRRPVLALLGFSPALTIGTLAAISLFRPMLNPRWLSFLVPFYALITACGLLVIGDRVARHRARGAAIITTAVILSGLPVLALDYLDPAFRPFQWRNAVHFVEQYAKPDDVIIYANAEAATSFAYYLREPHSTLILTPREVARSSQSALTAAAVRRFAKVHPRAWLVVTVPFTDAMRERLYGTLNRAYEPTLGRDFAGIEVYALVAQD